MDSHLPILLSATATLKAWPDGIDLTITLGYVAMLVGLVVFAPVSMGLHVRAYLRSLHRALMIVTGYRAELPEWVRRQTPRCILALGLTMPCTADDIRAAYRRKVKRLHPDRGGDRRQFLRLQAHFEEALAAVEGR
jgi:hypothetical protein